MRKTEILAYTAGIIDGEGCITILNKPDCHSDKVYVDVTNTNQWICEWLKMQFGGRVRTCKPHKLTWRPTFKWYIEGNRAMEFLRLIIPYLNIKKTNAEVVIAYQSKRKMGGHYSQEDKVLMEANRVRIKHLNKKGV